jgi:hypothetical protein
MVERCASSSTSWGSLVRAQYRPSRKPHQQAPAGPTASWECACKVEDRLAVDAASLNCLYGLGYALPSPSPTDGDAQSAFGDELYECAQIRRSLTLIEEVAALPVAALRAREWPAFRSSKWTIPGGPRRLRWPHMSAV